MFHAIRGRKSLPIRHQNILSYKNTLYAFVFPTLLRVPHPSDTSKEILSLLSVMATNTMANTISPALPAYGLPRNAQESVRLNGQHDVYTTNMGFLLHPTIEAALLESAAAGPVAVADVATGTGIWMLETSIQLPDSVRFVGLDISDVQFPQPGSYPDNCSFRTLNILEPIPADLQDQFDVAHIRLLTCGLRSDQWATVARNVLQLLKHGGWLQWTEADGTTSAAVQSVPEASIERALKFREAMIAAAKRAGRFNEDVSSLNHVIASAGFTEVRRCIFSSDRVPEMREKASRLAKGAGDGALAMLAKNDPGAIGMTAEEVRKLSKGCDEDFMDARAYLRWNIVTAIGRKPL